MDCGLRCAGRRSNREETGSPTADGVVKLQEQPSMADQGWPGLLINPKEVQASCCVRKNNEMASYSDLSDETGVPSFCIENTDG